MKRITALCLLAALAGCSNVTSGEVVDKRHEDVRIYWDQVPVYQGVPVRNCYGTGKAMHCSTSYQQRVTGYMPQQRVDDEDWVLVLQNGDKQGEVQVSEETFNSVERGQWFGEED